MGQSMIRGVLMLAVLAGCVIAGAMALGWPIGAGSASAAQAGSVGVVADGRVEVVPRQSAGDAAEWRLREIRTERVGDEGEDEVTVVTRRGTVRVLEADEKILVVEWTESAWWEGDAAAGGDDGVDGDKWVDGGEAPPALSIKPTLAGSTVELVVSRDGHIQTVRNADALRSSLIAAIGEQARAQAERMGDAETAEVQAAIARNMLDSPGLLRAVVMRDVSPYFFGYGWKLGLGEVMRFEDSLPNDYGTEPLPVLASCEIVRDGAGGGVGDEVGSGTDVFRVLFTQETDAARVPEIMRRSVDELLARNREVARAAGLAVDDDDQNGVETEAFAFSIRDDAVFSYDAGSGWIRRAEWTRRSVAGDLVQTVASTWDVTPVVRGGDLAVRTGAAAQERGMDRKTEFATFGAGCFWGVEVTFRNSPGVVDAAVGYTGGSVSNPTYKQVCTGATGHAEVVHVEFDPAVVGYDKLLEVFFRNHNPTTLNRQGPDIGTQYRSAVFYHSAGQKAEAERVMARMQAEFQSAGRFGGRAIVTTLEPFETFYRAEEYHQRYLEKRGLATCSTSDE